MNLLKIFFPNKILDRSVDGGTTGSSSESKEAMGVFSPNSSPSNSIPTPTLASEVVGISLNTQARQILGGYTFGQVGALAVGKYINGVSGDIRISPSGIVGRNSGGINTFTIDGVTGDATFLGTVTATAGLIGGFTIASSYLYAGTGANTAGLSPADYPFWAGDTYANRATAPFTVTPAGAVNATNITVTDIIVNVTAQTTVGAGADFRYSNASRVRINGNGVIVRNTRGFFMEETTSGNFGSLAIGSDNIMVLKAGETTDAIWFEDHVGDRYASFIISNDHHTFSCNSFLRLWSGVHTDTSDISDGTMWYDTDDNKIKCKVNGALRHVDTSAV